MPAAARPYWTGFLKLSLVTIAVRLYAAATEQERVHFHMIHEPSGERVRTQTVVPGLGPVERDEIVKGYEYEKGRYVTIAPNDLDSLKLETTDTIDISQFVDEGGFDPAYIAAPYYLVPDGSLAEEGYRVFREALRRTQKVAVGQVVINARERPVAIRPYRSGLLVEALRFNDEVRDAEPFFAGIAEGPADPDELAMMEQIVARRSSRFDPGKFVDHYQAALKEVISAKLAGKVPERPPERKPAQIINLMDALKRSLAEEPRHAGGTTPRRAGKKPSSTARAGTAKTARAQGSLLLPVKGGRDRAGRPAPAEAAAPPRRSKKA